ncbi:MAG: HEPN domain-containing protein [Oscillatoria sp. SIO1A7]|nr:HEPN domain-containing protein [Oscillatoria sp. SIO1A7]
MRTTLRFSPRPDRSLWLDKADKTLQAARILCERGFFDSAASHACLVRDYF